jgi:hypothetical protein
MELFDNLASMGFTTKVLQVIIVLSIIVFFLGKYWQQIPTWSSVLCFVWPLFPGPTKSDKIEVTQ